jgi:hypothetical protein
MARGVVIQCGNCPNTCPIAPMPVPYVYGLLEEKATFKTGMRILNGDIIVVSCQWKHSFIKAEMVSDIERRAI